MPVVKLVEDLIPTILDSTNWSVASSSLLNFALVSPSWLWPVRCHLYKNPVITSENQCRYLVRTLESVPALQPLVIGVSLWLDDPPFAARGRSAVRVVLSLPSLQHISFLAPTATFLMSKIQNHAAITHLSIMPDNHPVSIRFSPSRSMMEWGPKQASKFTSLKKLVLSGASLHITPPPPHLPYSFHLNDLILSRCTVTYGDISELLDPLAWSRIRILVLMLPPSWDASTHSLVPLLSLCADTLVRLHLQYDSLGNVTGALTAGRIFETLRALRPLQLRVLRSLRLVDVGPQQQRRRALRDIAACCPGLTDLTISGYFAGHMLCEWGWPQDLDTTFPALEMMAGPARVLAPSGLWGSSTGIWGIAQAGSERLRDIQWKEDEALYNDW